MADPKDETKQQRIKFHYVKSPFFHAVHCDGALGGLTPRGGIHVALFAERLAIPQQTEQLLGDDGKLGQEVLEARVSRDGVVRELQVDAIMDLEVAVALRDFLSTQIELLRATLDKEGQAQ